jgi:hypothetical protein
MYCGGPLTCTSQLKFKRCEVPVYGGVKVYECQLGDGNDGFHSIVGEIVRNKKDPNKHALRNMTEQVWNVKLPDNSVRAVEPNGIVPLNKDFEITIGRNTGIVG